MGLFVEALCITILINLPLPVLSSLYFASAGTFPLLNAAT